MSPHARARACAALSSLSVLAGVTACPSHDQVRVTSPPHAEPAQTPPPAPEMTCGAPPPLVPAPFERTTLDMGPPAACHRASSTTRILGVAGVATVPWGLVSLGGAELCALRDGAAGWESLYDVHGDNLYRVAGDALGRLLAAWEKDPYIHLFVPDKRQHIRFRKPPAPSPANFEWGVSDLFFSEDGKTATVMMENRPATPPTTSAAYLLDLDAPVPPKPLFVQTGLRLHAALAASVFAVPKNEKDACFDLGCWPIAEIRAWEVKDGVARCKTLLSGEGDWLERARAMPKSDDDRQVAVLISERSRARGILRWRYGDAKAETRALPAPAGPSWAGDASRLTRTGDLLEVWTTDTWGLTVQRHDPAGQTTSVSLPPLPRRGGLTDTEGVHLVKERANGDLFVHWGDYLLLLPVSGPTHLMNLDPVPGRREWAWVDIYVPRPEALWIGVEGGGPREFFRLGFSEIERSAKPWPAEPASAK